MVDAGTAIDASPSGTGDAATVTDAFPRRTGDARKITDASAGRAPQGSREIGSQERETPSTGQVPAVDVPLHLRVVEKGSRRPIGNATVTIDAGPVGETDAGGHLVCPVTAGWHQIEAQVPGYVPLRLRANTETTGAEIVLRLVPSTTGERFESEVRSARGELPRVSVPGEEARQTAGTSGDPVRVIASLPGVSQIAWPAAVFVIRGSNPGNTGFFIDGVRVPAMFHLALGPSIIHPSLFGGLDFYPGAFPENFGRYVAGVVSIRTVAPPTDRAHLAADVTLYDAGAIATAPVDGGRGVVAAAARYSYTGPVLHLFDPTTTLRYGDYQLRFDHVLWGGRATVFAFGSLDELDWLPSGVIVTPTGDFTGKETAALQFHRLDLRWQGVIAGGRLLAGTTAGYDHSRSTLYASPISVEAADLAPRVMWTRPLGRTWDMELGADAELQHFTAHPAVFQGKQSDLARSRGALSQGTFAAARLHTGENLLIAAGLRADFFAEEGTTRVAWEPRLDARLTLSPALALKANAGRFAQMPSLPVNVAGFEAFGLSSIGLQRSDSVSGGADAHLPGDIQVELTGFYSRMRVTDIRNLDIQSMMPTRDDYLVMRDGVGYGAELLVRRPSTHRLYGWLAYTLSYSLRNIDGVVARSDWDQRHIVNLVAGDRIGRGYAVSARVHFNTGRNAALFNAAGGYRQIPSYTQIDLRAERRFLFDRFILDVFVDIANATFNRELIQYVTYRDALGNDVSQPGYLRLILPTIGVHGEF